MLIEIHAIQNHAPNNLNRDDLGAPKTTVFGGTLRSRISSQCLKRSIRTSDEFKDLLGGVRTRRLAQLIEEEVNKTDDVKKLVKNRAIKVLKKCGLGGKKEDDSQSTMLVYTTKGAIRSMATALLEYEGDDKNIENEFQELFAELISSETAVPDMALCGRMLEPSADVLKKKNNTVEASLQAAHAISTHTARPEIDYYVAADDVKGEDAGAGFVDEALYSSACFYKYFSIDWEQLVRNLNGNEALAAHTVGAFIRAMALTTPSGKQNSFAAHNPPDGILIEVKDKNTPISYANAFVKPVDPAKRDLVEQSIAQLAQYVCDMDNGYGAQGERFWFSPGGRYPLVAYKKEEVEGKTDKNGEPVSKRVAMPVTSKDPVNLTELVSMVVGALGYDWDEVQKHTMEARHE